jgi:2-dehydropantoate 2-reductase
MIDICVYGTGGVGGYFGAKLIAADNPETRISFISRNQGLAAIRKDGLILNASDGRQFTTRPFTVTDDIREAPAPDFILLCVKEYDLNNAIEAVARVADINTVVMPLLNGIDIYNRVRAGLPRGIVLPSTVTISVHLDAPGVVSHNSGLGIIKTGPDPTRPEYIPKAILEVFKTGNLNVEWHTDPFPAIWEKYIFIAPFGLITSAYDKTIGEVVSDPELKDQVNGIMREIKAIAAKTGVTLPEDILETTMDKARAFPFDTKTSLQRDVENSQKKNELALFGGSIIRMGKETGTKTPVTERVFSVFSL